MKKILLLILILSGCSHSPVKLLPLPTNENSPQFGYAKSFQQAKEDLKLNKLDTACASFSELLEEREFAGAEAAHTYFIEYCPISDYRLKKSLKNLPSKYLRDAYLTAIIKRANEKHLEELKAESMFLLANEKKVKFEKQNLINEALLIAKKLGDNELISKYQNAAILLSPSLKIGPDQKNNFEVARDYESKRKFELARDEYLKIIESNEFSNKDKYKAYNLYRTSFKTERKLELFREKSIEMENYFKQIYETSKAEQDLELWIDSIIAHARAIWTDHYTQEAKDLLLSVDLELPININQKATIYWLLGSISLELKENKSALKFFKIGSELNPNDSKLNENLKWAYIWNLYLLHQYKEMITAADTIIKKSNNLSFQMQIKFWKAKALQKNHKNEAAQSIYNEIWNDDNFNYYGILAMSELKKPLPLIQVRGLSENVLSNDLTLDWLIYLGETNFARSYLQEVNGDLKKSVPRDNMFFLYDQTKWYQGAIRHLSSYPQSKKNEMTTKYSNVIFPNVFDTTIESSAKKYQVPRELILSIMRQESVYVPTERSPADAFGLMQLIPERARVLARDHEISYGDYNDLYRPEVNIELGTALLSRLMKDNQFKFAETVASYNADPKAMKKWLAERFHGDYLEFIEMIPYEETRNYIKLVFRNFITYKRIFGPEAILLDPKFFELPFN